MDDSLKKSRGITLQGYARTGQYEQVKRLLEEGNVDVDMVDNADNRTTLHDALYGGYDDIALMLIEHGANISAKDIGDETPLHVAAMNNCSKSLAKLIGMIPTVDVQNGGGVTPLIYAVTYCHDDICRALIKAHADVNYEMWNGLTPLIEAAAVGNTEICRMLLDHGAEINKGPSTPLAHAARSNKAGIAMCKLLLANGADINGAGGSLPVLEAANADEILATARYLLRQGAKKVLLQKDHDIIDDMLVNVDVELPLKTVPERETCLRDGQPTDLLLDSCVIDKFHERIADQLINANTAESLKLLQDICHALPEHWKNQFSGIAASIASQDVGPAKTLPQEGKTHG